MKCYFLIWAAFLSNLTVSDSWLYGIRSYFGEICHSPSISLNSTALKIDLETMVFGQPFVQELIPPLLKLHLSEVEPNRRALVLSFHGPPGTGKNHVAKIIAKNIYEKGMSSKFVHLLKPVLHFAGESTETTKEKLQKWIIGNVTECKKQLFIFDEVNDMPQGVLEAISGFIDYDPIVGELDFSQCIFIFLSNVGMESIKKLYFEKWVGGEKLREKLEYEGFAKIIIEHSLARGGGFEKCGLISNKLIDAFVPFLPLERVHVRNCIQMIAAEYTNVQISKIITDYILEKVEFVPEELKLYSSHGCKNLETPIKVALVKYNYKLKDEL